MQIIKSRWHVPLQVLGTIIAIVGYFLGHRHGGRQFVEGNVHAKFASTLMFFLAVQVGLGIYLKLHLEKGINGKIRRFIKPCHGVLGKTIPVLSWVQMLFGGITTLGFCQGDHLGQCLAHFIMGSAFIAYGIILTILLLVGQLWLPDAGGLRSFSTASSLRHGAASILLRSTAGAQLGLGMTGSTRQWASFGGVPDWLASG